MHQAHGDRVENEILLWQGRHLKILLILPLSAVVASLPNGPHDLCFAYSHPHGICSHILPEVAYVTNSTQQR